MARTPEEKKAYREAIDKKNRHHQGIFAYVRFRRNEAERVKKLEEQMQPSEPEQQKDDVGDKVAAIRNRLNGKKRMSKERWNRFAGTGSAGARGL